MRSLWRSQTAQLKRFAPKSKRNVQVEEMRKVMEGVFFNVSVEEQVSATVRVTTEKQRVVKTGERVEIGSDWAYKANKS